MNFNRNCKRCVIFVSFVDWPKCKSHFTKSGMNSKPVKLTLWGHIDGWWCKNEKKWAPLLNARRASLTPRASESFKKVTSNGQSLVSVMMEETESVKLRFSCVLGSTTRGSHMWIFTLAAAVLPARAKWMLAVARPLAGSPAAKLNKIIAYDPNDLEQSSNIWC